MSTPERDFTVWHQILSITDIDFEKECIYVIKFNYNNNNINNNKITQDTVLILNVQLYC